MANDEDSSATAHRIAASQAPVEVAGAPVEVVLTPLPDSARAAPGGRVLLALEDVERPGRAGSYDVYLNLPARARPEDHPDHFAGRVSLYAPRASGGAPPRRFEFVLDVTNVHRALVVRDPHADDPVRVTIVPVQDWGDAVTVGRVSLSLG